MRATCNIVLLPNWLSTFSRPLKTNRVLPTLTCGFNFHRRSLFSKSYFLLFDRSWMECSLLICCTTSFGQLSLVSSRNVADKPPSAPQANKPTICFKQGCVSRMTLLDYITIHRSTETSTIRACLVSQERANGYISPPTSRFFNFLPRTNPFFHHHQEPHFSQTHRTPLHEYFFLSKHSFPHHHRKPFFKGFPELQFASCHGSHEGKDTEHERHSSCPSALV